MKKRLFTLILLVSVLITSVMPAAFAVSTAGESGEAAIKVIASEDFSNGMSGWINEVSDDFYVLNEKLNVSAEEGRRMSIAAATAINLDNCEVEFDMNLGSGEYFAVMPRYVDETTLYCLKFYPNKNTVTVQKRVNGGSYTDIKNGKVTLNENQTYRVKLSLSGIKISLYMDGNLVLEFEDDSIVAGRLAFGANNAKASVDNISVYKDNTVNYEANIVVKEAKKIYVAPDGNDKTGDGSEMNPYATIAHAKTEAVKLNDSRNAVDVVFKEGVYRIASTVSFKSEDSGSATAPIRYVAEEGAQVTFTGAKAVDTSKFTSVSENMLEKLRPNVRNKVMQVDLGKQGFNKENLNFVAREKPGQRVKMTNVTLNGTLQNIARWPNSGYKEITDCDNTSPAKLFYTDNIPTRWKDAKNFFIDGFLYHDWAPEWAMVDNVDTLTNTINFKSRTSYGIRTGGKWAAVNLLEELDIPGEWYIDFDTMIMYYYPPHKLTSNDSLEIANSSGYVLSVAGAKNLTFEGLHITMTNGSNGTGVNISSGSENILFKDCIVDNVNRHGFRVLANNITIDGCIINSVGETGISVEESGDITNAIDGNVVIKNCDISRPSLYAGGNGTAGITTGEDSIGVTAINNVIHNCGNNAIRYKGLAHRFAYNEFYNCMIEAADAGAIYTGRSWNWYGTVAEYNLFHHLGQKQNTTQYSANAMFWDDLNSGCEFSHNIVVQDGKPKTGGVSSGGGTDNVIVGNTIVNAAQGMGGNTRRNYQDYESWEKYAIETLKWGSKPILTDPYVKRFPKMATVLDRIKENGGIHKRMNTATDNLLVDCATPINFSTEMTVDATIENNTILADNYEIFVNPDDLDYRVKKSAKAEHGISDVVLDEDFDMNSIGIQGEGKRELDRKTMEFNMLYPHNGDATVTQDRTVLAWSRAYMADEYTYTVAEDPEFTKIVAMDKTIRTSADLENLDMGKTYYWKVTAHNQSRQYGCDVDAPEGVWSFSIDPKSPLDISGLKLSVENAETVIKTMKESNKPGDYKVGATKTLKEKIAVGKKWLEQKTGDQKEIDAIAYDINRSITNLEGFVNAGYTTLDLSPTSPWVVNKSAASKVNITKENGQVKFTVGAKSEISLNETLSNYNVMCFKTKVDNFNNKAWFAYGLRALSTETNIYSQDAYYILIKEDIFELQKRGVIYKTAPNNGKFKAGTWHNLKFGSITTENGINMYFELDGEVIFDYLDKSSPQKRPGMFAMFASTTENVIELAPADNVPTGLYTLSDAIVEEMNTDASAGGILGTYSDEYSEKGTWADSPTAKGDSGVAARTANEDKSTATWSMNVGKEGNAKLYKVYYYHIPTPNGDKNVKVKLSGYQGEYTTTIDLSAGTEGYVELGTFSMMDADYIGRLSITFDASGEGEVNISHVKYEQVDSGEDLLK